MKKGVVIGTLLMLVGMFSFVSATELCRENGPFVSDDYTLSFNNFLVEADRDPVLREDTISMKFNVTNTGAEDILFKSDGVSARVEDPSDIFNLVGTVLGAPSPPLAAGESIGLSGEFVLNQEGLWKVRPYFVVDKVGGVSMYGIPPADWHACEIDVLLSADETDPEVSITHWPEQPLEGEFVQITANATDNVELDRIDILITLGGGEHYICNESPCTWTIQDLELGQFSYSSTAYDTSGNSKVSNYGVVEVVSEDVDSPEATIGHEPLIPAFGEEFVISVNASDAGGVKKIELFVNGFIVEICSGEEVCEYRNDSYAEDSFVTYFARVYDESDNMFETPSGNLRVGKLESNSPELVLTVSDHNPTAIETVLFNATAVDESPMDRIEIYVNDEIVHVCNATEECLYTGGPYTEWPNGSNRFSAHAFAYDVYGHPQSTLREWIFIGWPFLNNRSCQPMTISNYTHWNKIDILFVPDGDYNGNLNEFIWDMDAAIQNAYWASPTILAERDKFNFYYYRENASANRTEKNGSWSCRPVADARAMTLDCGFRPESIGIIHKGDCRDSAMRNPPMFTTEPGSSRTMIHELGHSLFGLSDEYCCDTGYMFPERYPNIWRSNESCRQYATLRTLDPDNCVHIAREFPSNASCQAAVSAGGVWSGGPKYCRKFGDVWTGQDIWRMDPSPDIMREAGNPVYPFRSADIFRTDYIFRLYDLLEQFDNLVDAFESGIGAAAGGWE
jgi:hypothetical protein